MPINYVTSTSLRSFLRTVRAAFASVVAEYKATFNGHTVWYNGYSARVRLCMFEGAAVACHFDPAYLRIGVHRNMQFAAGEALRDALYHITAQLIARMHFPRDLDKGLAVVYKVHQVPASIQSADVLSIPDVDVARVAKVTDKIRKLLALTESANQHEAALAMQRAQKLMADYNLANTAGDDDEYITRTVLKFKRSNPRYTAIGGILEHFFVAVTQSNAGLNLTGTHANVEQAEYIAQYLDRELKRIWTEARKSAKAASVKLTPKAFFVALHLAFIEKLNADKMNTCTALVLQVSREARQARDFMFNTTTGRKSRYNDNAASAAAGQAAGRNLNIRTGVGSSGTGGRLLSA